MNRKAALTGAVVLMGLLAPHLGPAAVSGTIKYACVSPAFTLAKATGQGVTEQGVCGYLINPLPAGTQYTLTPALPADLDIHFYDAANNVVDQFAGPGTIGTGCGALSKTRSSAAVKAVVVATPSTCVNQPGWAPQGSEYNINFTYSSW